MPQYLPLPDGSYFEAPEGASYEQTLALAKKKYPDVFPDLKAERDAQRGFFSSFGRGFTGALKESGPTALAGLEAPARAMGATGIAGWLEQQQAPQAAPEIPPVHLRDIKDWGTLKQFAGEAAGSGFGSTLMPIVSGGIGALAGAATPVPGGALIGGYLGAGSTALPLNTGDLYKGLQEEGVPKERAAELATMWGPVISVPDLVSMGILAKPFLKAPTQVVVKELAQKLAAEGGFKTAAKGVGKGIGLEAVTEGPLQQGIQEGVAAYATGKPFFTPERMEKIAEAGIAGGFVGGPFGGMGRFAERGGARTFLEKEAAKEKIQGLMAAKQAEEERAKQAELTRGPQLPMPLEGPQTTPPIAPQAIAEKERITQKEAENLPRAYAVLKREADRVEEAFVNATDPVKEAELAGQHQRFKKALTGMELRATQLGIRLTPLDEQIEQEERKLRDLEKKRQAAKDKADTEAGAVLSPLVAQQRKVVSDLRAAMPAAQPDLLTGIPTLQEARAERQAAEMEAEAPTLQAVEPTVPPEAGAVAQQERLAKEEAFRAEARKRQEAAAARKAAPAAIAESAKQWGGVSPEFVAEQKQRLAEEEQQGLREQLERPAPVPPRGEAPRPVQQRVDAEATGVVPLAVQRQLGINLNKTADLNNPADAQAARDALQAREDELLSAPLNKEKVDVLRTVRNLRKYAQRTLTQQARKEEGIAAPGRSAAADRTWVGDEVLRSLMALRPEGAPAVPIVTDVPAAAARRIAENKQKMADAALGTFEEKLDDVARGYLGVGQVGPAKALPGVEAPAIVRRGVKDVVSPEGGPGVMQRTAVEQRGPLDAFRRAESAARSLRRTLVKEAGQAAQNYIKLGLRAAAQERFNNGHNPLTREEAAGIAEELNTLLDQAVALAYENKIAPKKVRAQGKTAGVVDPLAAIRARIKATLYFVANPGPEGVAPKQLQAAPFGLTRTERPAFEAAKEATQSPRAAALSPVVDAARKEQEQAEAVLTTEDIRTEAELHTKRFRDALAMAKSVLASKQTAYSKLARNPKAPPAHVAAAESAMNRAQSKYEALAKKAENTPLRQAQENADAAAREAERLQKELEAAQKDTSNTRKRQTLREEIRSALARRQVPENEQAILQQVVDTLDQDRGSNEFMDAAREQLRRLEYGQARNWGEVQDRLQQEARLRAGEGVQGELFPAKEVAVARTTPERFQKYLGSKEVKELRQELSDTLFTAPEIKGILSRITLLHNQREALANHAAKMLRRVSGDRLTTQMAVNALEEYRRLSTQGDLTEEEAKQVWKDYLEAFAQLKEQAVLRQKSPLIAQRFMERFTWEHLDDRSFRGMLDELTDRLNREEQTFADLKEKLEAALPREAKTKLTVEREKAEQEYWDKQRTRIAQQRTLLDTISPRGREEAAKARATGRVVTRETVALGEMKLLAPYTARKQLKEALGLTGTIDAATLRTAADKALAPEVPDTVTKRRIQRLAVNLRIAERRARIGNLIGKLDKALEKSKPGTPRWTALRRRRALLINQREGVSQFKIIDPADTLQRGKPVFEEGLLKKEPVPAPTILEQRTTEVMGPVQEPTNLERVENLDAAGIIIRAFQNAQRKYADKAGPATARKEEAQATLAMLATQPDSPAKTKQAAKARAKIARAEKSVADAFAVLTARKEELQKRGLKYGFDLTKEMQFRNKAETQKAQLETTEILARRGGARAGTRKGAGKPTIERSMKGHGPTVGAGIPKEQRAQPFTINEREASDYAADRLRREGIPVGLPSDKASNQVGYAELHTQYYNEKLAELEKRTADRAKKGTRRKGRSGNAYHTAPATKTVTEPTPTTVHQMALAELRSRGWDTNWPFIPADLMNADFRELIDKDPTLTREEKDRILSFAPGGNNEIKLQPAMVPTIDRGFVDANVGLRPIGTFNSTTAGPLWFNQYEVRTSAERIDLAVALKLINLVRKNLPTGIQFEYYPTLEDVPENDRNVWAKDLTEDADSVQGFVTPSGRVGIVGSTHANADELTRTILHELIGHYGVDTVLGPEGFKQLTERVWAEGEKGVWRLASEMGMVDALDGIMAGDQALQTWLKENPNKDLTHTPYEAKLNIVRELIAHATEHTGKPSSAWQSFIKKVVNAVRKVFGLPERVTSQEIFSLLKEAQTRYNENRLGPYFDPGGRTAFRTDATPMDKGANLVYGAKPTLIDMGNAAYHGMDLEARLFDRYANIAKAFSKSPRDRALQVMQWFRSLQDVHNMTAVAMDRGVPQIVAETQPDGTVQKTFGKREGEKRTSFKDVLDAIKLSGLKGDVAERRFGFYATMRRAESLPDGWERLNTRYNTDPEYKADMDRAVAETKQYLKDNPDVEAAFKHAHDVWNQWNKELLDFMVETGALPKRYVQALQKRGDYVAWYRVAKDGNVMLNVGVEHPIHIGDIKNQPYLHKLMAGDQEIVPFFDGAIRNLNILLNMGMRNQAVREMAFKLGESGLLEPIKDGNRVIRDGPLPRGQLGMEFTTEPKPEEYEKTDPKEWGRLGQRHILFDKDLMMRETGVAPELLLRGLEGVVTQLPLLIRWAAMPARILRKTVMRTPLYAVRQLLNDIPSFLFTSGAKLDFPLLLKTTKEILTPFGKKSEEMEKLYQSGLLGGNLFVGTEEDKQVVARRLASASKDWKENAKSWGGIMGMLDSMAQRVDAHSRVYVYSSLRKQGLSHMEAMMATRAALDFNRRGYDESTHMLASMIPFFNTQLQSLYSLYHAGTGKNPFSKQLDIRRKFYTWGALSALAGVAYAAAMSGDEDYDKMTEQERMRYWIIPKHLTGTQAPVRIRKPFEVGTIFPGMAEAIYNHTAGNRNRGFGDALIGALNNMTPSVIPLAAKLPIEHFMGKDFFTGQDIESARDKTLHFTERYGPKTTEMAKYMSNTAGRFLNWATFGKWEISPKDIDHVARGLFTNIGTFVMSIANPMLRDEAAGAGKIAARPHEDPLFGSMFQNPHQTGYWVDQALTEAERIAQSRKTYEQLKKQGRNAEAEQLKQQFGKNIVAGMGGSAATTYKSMMNKIAEQQRIIINAPSTSIPPERKRALLDKLDDRRNELSKRFLTALDRSRVPSLSTSW